MNRYLTVVASFLIMLCIGSVYAWSIIAAELMEDYGFSASQSQIIFGAIIAIFPITMIFTGQLSKRIKYKYFGYISGLLFIVGYSFASYSQGSFVLILIGIGVIVGISTGLGYWVSLTAPVQLFPEKKGLVTGIASAGFGLGAVFMAELSKILLSNGYNALELLKIVGIAYGLIILILSNFIYQEYDNKDNKEATMKVSDFISSKIFKKLFLGLFMGSFAGLVIIGSLSIIGGQYEISEHILILGVSIFALSNFMGRLFWGFFSDHVNGSLSIFLSLLFQSLSILSLNILPLTDISYLIIVLFIGFGYGGNFTLFAKETAQIFGVKNLGIIYPYVFLGYAIAGIAGPLSGGLLYDLSKSFFYPIILAGFMSLAGSMLFLNELIASRKNANTEHS